MKQIEYHSVILLLTNGCDEIFFDTYWPSPNGNGPLRLRSTAPRDQGLAYIRQHCKCDPERIVDVRILPDD